MLIIGIAGGTGSGKTTVVRRIVERIDQSQVVIIPQDNYYKDQSHLSIEQRQALNFDHPSAIEFELLVTHLKALKKGENINLPQYSYLTCTRSEDSIPIEPKKVVIVEGMMTLVNDGLVDMLDVKVFVDAEPDDRLIRCIQRDIEERGRNFSTVVDRYYKTVKPMHRLFIEPSKKKADLLIPHGGENTVAIDLVVARIEVELLKK